MTFSRMLKPIGIFILLVGLTIITHKVSHDIPSPQLALMRWLAMLTLLAYILWWILRLQIGITYCISRGFYISLIIGMSFALTGALLNMTVVLANGGHMPVLDSILEGFMVSGKDVPIFYIPSSTGILIPLSDIYLSGLSLGDLFLCPVELLPPIAYVISIIKRRRGRKKEW